MCRFGKNISKQNELVHSLQRINVCVVPLILSSTAVLFWILD